MTQQTAGHEIVGAVVVHWRGMDDTRECLASLAASDCEGLRIIVVVNGPGDFDETVARNACPAVTIVHAPENEGYGAGCNRGLAALPGAAIVVFLNNDVVLARDAISNLRAALDAQPRAAIVGPIVTYYDDPARVWSAGGFVHPWLGYTRHHDFNAASAPEGIRSVDFVNGCTIAVRRDAIDRLNGIDAAYFHYFEDTDLSARARGLGYDCIVTSDASVRHKVSASAGERGSNRFNRVQAYYFSRNRVLFVRRNFRGARRITAMLAQPLLLLPYELAQDARARNWTAARGRIAGVIDGMRGRDGAKDVSA